MLSDLRFAFRQLGKSPGFTVTAVLTLALGIGACTAMFSIVNAVLLRPLPFPEEEQLVQVWENTDRTIFPQGLAYKLWREESKLLAEIALSTPVSRTTTDGAVPERLNGLRVSANYLHLLRRPPARGSDFVADAETPGGNSRVVLLSHALWQTRYGGDPAVLGRTIALDEIPHVVIGVLAPRSLPRDDTQFLVPFVHTPQALGVRRVARPALLVTARLQPGVTPAQAEAELSAIMQANASAFGPAARPLSAAVVPLREQLMGAARPTMLMLLGAGLLVLLIACANVANLLLARATGRTKEMAVRAALGASKARILTQVLTENLMLALLGGSLAAILAVFAVDLLAHVSLASTTGNLLGRMLTGGEIPTILRPEVDWVVLSFAFAIASATGIGCGLFPAWRAWRADVNRDLKDAARGASGGGRTRTQSTLVAAEVALASMLLIGAGLFLRSFGKVLAVDLGFEPAALHSFDLSLPGTTYADTTRRNQFIAEIRRRLLTLPGIDSVSATTDAPFGTTPGLGGGIGLATESDRTRDVTAGHYYVESDFFRTLGARLIRGRGFTAAEDQPRGPRVMVISESLARLLFGERDPIGGRLAFNGHEWEVIGVAGDTRIRTPEGGRAEFFYVPFAFSSGRASVLFRSALPPASLHDRVRKEVRSIDPAQPVAVRTMTDGIGQTLRGRHMVLMLVNTFAAVALLLACLGIYGVMAYTIGQRQREFGIRMALGASPPSIVGLVLRDGLRLALIGLGVGVIAALGGARLISALLFGVSPYEPLVYVTAFAALALIATFACWLPARRATNVDPIAALRAE